MQQNENQAGDGLDHTPDQAARVRALLKGEGATTDDQATEGKPKPDADAEAESKTSDQEVDQSEPNAETQEQDQGAPKNLNELAERLGVEVATLYDLEINMGDNAEPVTLGALKDAQAAASSLTNDRLEFEEERATYETELRQNQQDLADVIQALPRAALTNELLQKIGRHREQAEKRERALTLKSIPSWSDKAKETADREVMAAHLASFGYPEGALEAMFDHRTLSLVRDAALRKQRVDAALQDVRQVRETGHGTSSRPGKDNPNAPGGKQKRTSGSKRRRAAVDREKVSDLLKRQGIK